MLKSYVELRPQTFLLYTLAYRSVLASHLSLAAFPPPPFPHCTLRRVPWIRVSVPRMIVLESSFLPDHEEIEIAREPEQSASGKAVRTHSSRRDVSVA